MRRGRGSELLVLAAAALFAAALAVSFRPGRRPAAGKPRAVPQAPPASGEATTLLEGFDFTESVGDKPLMRIKADRTVGYGPAAGLAPNLYSGENVELTLYPSDGAPITVHSRHADYDERTRESKLTGNVRWSDKDGSLAEADQVVFKPKTRTMEVPTRVHFTQGTTDLTAPSARYDLAERVVHFGGPVEGSGGGTGAGELSKLTAREALYRRDSGALDLAGVDAQTQGGDRLAADRLVLLTSPQGGRPTSAHASGNVRGLLAAAVGPAGAAAGPGTANAADRQYAADEATVAFDAEGRMKTVTLDGAPALLSSASRRIAARRIEIGFENGRAVTARASGQVRADSENGRVEAAAGSVGFAPDGSVESVSLSGNVHLEGDGRGAQAETATEFAPRGVWVLKGSGSRSAQVQSGGSKLSGDTIQIDRGRQTVSGEGHARAVFSPDSQARVRPSGFVGDPKKPTFSRADRIVLEDGSRVATLSGSASLWQDDSSLFADDVTLADGDRTVTAVGRVRAVMAPAPARAAGTVARPASIITSRRLFYRDSDRTARFENGVAIHRGGWQASGGDATAWLSKEGTVESCEISGDVKMTDRSTGRSGEAEKILDSPPQDKTVLWGSPARVTDASGNRVAGAVLTIVDSGRSVEITAPEGGKTETIHRTEKN